jgi:hypothetical protein
MQGVSKKTSQWYSKCQYVASVTKIFTLKGVPTFIAQHLEQWIVYMPLSATFS